MSSEAFIRREVFCKACTFLLLLFILLAVPLNLKHVCYNMNLLLTGKSFHLAFGLGDKDIGGSFDDTGEGVIAIIRALDATLRMGQS